MMKKILMFFAVLLIVAVLTFIIIIGQEDSWIKDKRGVWIKHGNPKVKPPEVEQQEKIIDYASGVYNYYKSLSTDFSSQCLGTIHTKPAYAVDIVHVPRTAEDDLPENQCKDILSGAVSHFIELDKNGDIVRIV